MSLDKTLHTLAAALERTERFHRTLIWCVNLTVFLTSGIAAFLLRFDLGVPATEFSHLVWGLAVWLPVKSLVFRCLGLDRGWWRFVSVDDVLRIGFGNLAGSVVSFIAIRMLAPAGFPRSIYLLDLIICFLATAGARVAIRCWARAPRWLSSCDATRST